MGVEVEVSVEFGRQAVAKNEKHTPMDYEEHE
jgi:hypothetical protein